MGATTRDRGTGLRLLNLKQPLTLVRLLLRLDVALSLFSLFSLPFSLLLLICLLIQLNLGLHRQAEQLQWREKCVSDEKFTAV